jgi:hypothetical protein
MEGEYSMWFVQWDAGKENIHWVSSMIGGREGALLLGI